MRIVWFKIDLSAFSTLPVERRKYYVHFPPFDAVVIAVPCRVIKVFNLVLYQLDRCYLVSLDRFYYVLWLPSVTTLYIKFTAFRFKPCLSRLFCPTRPTACIYVHRLLSGFDNLVPQSLKSDSNNGLPVTFLFDKSE